MSDPQSGPDLHVLTRGLQLLSYPNIQPRECGYHFSLLNSTAAQSVWYLHKNRNSTLAWKIPWAEEPGRLQSMGSQRVRHDWATSLSLSCIGEGNGNPLQRSCLENPRDGGAWWATVYEVTQSQTRLKWLSSSSSRSRVYSIILLKT